MTYLALAICPRLRWRVVGRGMGEVREGWEGVVGLCVFLGRG
jgi:hypothetical protein